MNLAIDLAILFAASSAVGFIAVYWATARWWRNRIGKSLMIQSLVLAATFIFTAFRRLTTAHVAISAATSWVTFGFFVAIGAAELQSAVAFAIEYAQRAGSVKPDRVVSD
jgi:hypothetical protein